jgi:hypothetical protein
MNTVERIVESYFRLCRCCFTYSDVKVVDGNNRQLDILAVSVVTGDQYLMRSEVQTPDPLRTLGSGGCG